MFESHQIPEYPPGVHPGDPQAPWNRTDPWEGHTCAECEHCMLFLPKKYTGYYPDGDGHVCITDGEALEISSDDKACEGFQGRA